MNESARSKWIREQVELDVKPSNILYRWLPEDKSTLVRANMTSANTAYLEPFERISIDPQPFGAYTLGDEPMWVTDRIAALSIMDIPPPPNFVDGVGIRIDADTFWIVAPKKENYGTDS